MHTTPYLAYPRQFCLKTFLGCRLVKTQKREKREERRKKDECRYKSTRRVETSLCSSSSGARATSAPPLTTCKPPAYESTRFSTLTTKCRLNAFQTSAKPLVLRGSAYDIVHFALQTNRTKTHQTHKHASDNHINTPLSFFFLSAHFLPINRNLVSLTSDCLEPNALVLLGAWGNGQSKKSSRDKMCCGCLVV